MKASIISFLAVAVTAFAQTEQPVHLDSTQRIKIDKLPHARIRADVTKVTEDGALASYSVDDGKRYTQKQDHNRNWHAQGEQALIKGIPGAIPGLKWEGEVILVGKYSNKKVLGTKHTYQWYATSPDAAAQVLARQQKTSK